MMYFTDKLTKQTNRNSCTLLISILSTWLRAKDRVKYTSNFLPASDFFVRGKDFILQMKVMALHVGKKPLSTSAALKPVQITMSTNSMVKQKIIQDRM